MARKIVRGAGKRRTGRSEEDERRPERKRDDEQKQDGDDGERGLLLSATERSNQSPTHSRKKGWMRSSSAATFA